MVSPARIDKDTHAVMEELRLHIHQTHVHAFDVAFDGGYRLALCHFGKCLEDMKHSDEQKRDLAYQLAVFQMCTRHEEMVKLINGTPIKEVIAGKEGEWVKDDVARDASEGLASLFG